MSQGFTNILHLALSSTGLVVCASKDRLQACWSPLSDWTRNARCIYKIELAIPVAVPRLTCSGTTDFRTSALGARLVTFSETQGVSWTAVSSMHLPQLFLIMSDPQLSPRLNNLQSKQGFHTEATKLPNKRWKQQALIET